MDYAKALLFLKRFINYEKVPRYNYKRAYRLKRLKRLLSLLGNPQDCFPSVLIAGTKGKGSTAAILNSILIKAGVRTGLYTSPHLISFHERIRIKNREISKKEVVKFLAPIKNAADKEGLRGLTFFEILTALAFLYFRSKKVEMAILEVGLGGRLDATNVVRPLISVITPISYDHTHLLGHTLKEIAYEKCGIIKRGTFVISAPQQKEAERIIRKRACLKRAEALFVASDMACKGLKMSSGGIRFNAKTPWSSYNGLTTPLIGRHQALNSLTALSVAEVLREKFGFDIGKEDISRGIKDAEFPGRFQIIRKRPYLILDGAHNKASAAELKFTLERLFPRKKFYIILGISSDKDIEGIGSILCPMAEKVIFTKAESPRAEEPAVLAERLGRFCRDSYAVYSLRDAMGLAYSISDEEAVILITGSLFLVGDALKVFKRREWL